VDGTTNGGSDPNGHGTHVAGILGMRDNTVGGIGGAPSVQIFPVRVLNAQGSGSYSAVINGITDAMNNGANVISMSLGGSQNSASLQAKVTAAVNAGIVVVAAAGNDGSCSAAYPGRMTGVIAVASTDDPGSALSSFSSRGPDVDIAAPGRDILSTLNNNSYGNKSGTSMATPYVAAAAALLKAMCPMYMPADIETRLQTTTSPKIGNLEPGSGALNADLATTDPC
jgi:subtilisin